jgi:hypothetical protein
VNRRVTALAIPLALLSACGGGGTGGSVPPVNTTPQTKKTGTATFSFKLPGKNTMARVRRPYYQSQATQGVAIDWLSSNPSVPDYSAAISATCPALASLPPGVASCTVDAQGNTDYSFQLQIPAGTYTNFNVTTFDAPPSGGTFSGHMLAQGQLAAPVVIVAGTTNTVPNLTFYGVPASVSFVPGPAQSHVVTYGGNLAVIGNAPQIFYSQAADADGFAISSNDGGAPAITVAESSSDTPKEFTVATTANAYTFTLTAINAVANASIVVTATPGGTGLSPVATPYTVTPVQEMWTSQGSGGGVNGISGYPLYPPSYTPSVVLDYANPSLCGGSSCNWSWAALPPNGDGAIWDLVSGYGLFAFQQASGSQGLTIPSSPLAILGASPQAFTLDSQGRIYLTDTATNTIDIYSASGTLLASVADTNGSPAAVAIAPANAPSGMAGTIWVADSAGLTVYSAYAGSTPTQLRQLATGGPQGVEFDPSGNLWVYDFSAASLTDYTISSAGGASIGQNATTGSNGVPVPAGSNQFGITAQGTAWMGGPGSLNGMYPFALSGSTITAGSLVSSVGPNTLSAVWSVMIAP